MKNIIQAELFKMFKRRIFIGILCLSSFSLLYALGIYFKWQFIVIDGRVDIISFSTSMWALLMMLGIPLVLFSFLGASTLGGEVSDGQILLEIIRTKSRGKLVIGKFFSVSIALLICYLMSYVLSTLFYIIFISHSENGKGILLDFKDYHLHLVLESIVGCTFLVLFIVIGMLFSINFGTFRAVIFSMLVYVGLKFISNIEAINKWLPGYFTLVEDSDYSVALIIYHFAIIVGISILLLVRIKKQMKKKSL
ncbi:ABC transporter permease [Vagococcus entomophilus]|uniref:ABC transporter permease n=1 Tax=Vagococcus entomophilus TaxID=1160095 RepID=A0A430AHA7_9ENTE|nr:ABC transporter permease [Vagococcus entomophilus]RSU07312.1 ABC transporter permease [Vagococcus entomophilus]